MTLREISVAMEQIQKREYRRYREEATLHGIDLPSLDELVPDEDISPEHQAVLDRSMKEAQDRKRQEFLPDGR